MILIEKKQNIFELDTGQYYFAHCISTDCNMGAGIATDFNKKFHLKNELLSRNEIFRTPGNVILYKGVFNLFTKRHYYGKPDYNTIRASINEMAKYCKTFQIKNLAIPKIGCGLDKLSWAVVRNIIKQEFENIDIEIMVCHL